jgi:hypothetical protein
MTRVRGFSTLVAVLMLLVGAGSALAADPTPQ